MADESGYVRALRQDSAQAERYYLAGVGARTEQQKAIEARVAALPSAPQQVADIACGAGAASYHLGERLPQARFHLVDRNPDAVALAQRVMTGREARVECGDIYALGLDSGSFDLVLCLQTLSWLERPAQAVAELVRIARPGGTVLASSLFNLDADVDIRAEVVDRTRASAAEGGSYRYDTFSRATVAGWLEAARCEFRIHRFEIGIDLERDGRGLGTYTERLADGRRLQVSGGMLMNWGILQITKPAGADAPSAPQPIGP